MSDERRDGWMLRLVRQTRDLWVIAGITLLAVFLIDGILRNVLPGGTAEPQIDPTARRSAKRHADVYAGSDWSGEYYREFSASRSTRWEPYGYWRRAPFSGRHINVDDEGLRRTWNPAILSDAAQVWVFGGSTVWGTGVRDDHTIPSELSRLLAEDGAAARVTNFGQAGYVSTQEVVTLLRELQLGGRPDVVVFYDGVNDVYAALLEGTAGVPMNEENRRREFNVSRDWSGLLRAAVQRLEGLQRLAAIFRGRPAPRRPESLASDIVAHYEANVRAVRALASAHGFEAVFVWQPTIFTKRHVTDFEERTRDSRMVAHRDLQLEANRLVRQSALLGADTSFVDLTAALDAVEDPLYIDFCHLSEDGNRQIAEAMLPFVKTALSEM
jgi:lysophospholipase L1-like esterase